MKKTLITLACFLTLTGCERANQMIDEAQKSANEQVESLQNELKNLDINGLNLDLLQNSPELANQLKVAINEALQVDLSNHQAVSTAKSNIANAYSCLTEASSESTAQSVMDTLLANISNGEIKSIIDAGIQQADEYQVCVKK